MKKLLVAVFIGLTTMLFQIGCATSSYCNANYAYIPISLFPYYALDNVIESVNSCKKNAKKLEQACADFEAYDKAKIHHKDEHKLSETIKDYEKGLLSVQIKTLSGTEPKDIYCNKLKPTIISSETRSFAVNKNGDDDFNVKITKEVISADKMKEGKVLEKGIKTAAYKIEPINVIKYDGVLYHENSTFIKNKQKQFIKDYESAKKNVRKNLDCFKISGKVYCDRDIVKIYRPVSGAEWAYVYFMLIVRNIGNGQVSYDMWWYDEKPLFLANEMIKTLHKDLPNVVENHNLKIYEEQRKALFVSHLLNIKEVATFKEW